MVADVGGVQIRWRMDSRKRVLMFLIRECWFEQGRIDLELVRTATYV